MEKAMVLLSFQDLEKKYPSSFLMHQFQLGEKSELITLQAKLAVL